MKHLNAVCVRLVANWNDLARRRNPVAIVVATWALMTVPLLFLRGFNSDEGVAVTIARTALEDGHWLTPHMFNVRFVERPTLLSWIIAALSLPFGEVSQVTARFPAIASLLGGCLLIYALLRRVSASRPAALLGALLFLAAPLVLRVHVMATADLPLAVLLFAAFSLWWIGHSTQALNLRRWAIIGLVLALAGLLKGPQPIAYFAFGVGAFVLLSRSWSEIPGLILAGIVCVMPLAAWYWHVYTPSDIGTWAAFMRLAPGAALFGPLHASVSLIANAVPAIVLAAGFLLSLLFSWKSREPEQVPPAFVGAIVCYTLSAALVILFWPGGSAGRYFLPTILPICVLGGMAYDALASRRPAFIATMLSATLTIVGYGLIYSLVAAPLMPEKFRSSKIDGERIAEVVRSAPAPIYQTDATGLNVLPYVPGRILSTDVNALEKIEGPAWFAVSTEQANALLTRRPQALRIVMSFGQSDEWRLLRLDQ